MGLGIVEELFIATDPTTSLKEVWYRNSNVTQSLQVRQFLNANPTSVQWGTWKSKFVVRTGTSAATHQYFVFTLVRVGISSGADGLGPTAVAHYVRTETPATTALPLITVYASVTATSGETQLAVETTVGHALLNGAVCDGVIDSQTVTLSPRSVVDTGTKSAIFTLATLITGGNATVVVAAMPA